MKCPIAAIKQKVQVSDTTDDAMLYNSPSVKTSSNKKRFEKIKPLSS